MNPTSCTRYLKVLLRLISLFVVAILSVACNARLTGELYLGYINEAYRGQPEAPVSP